MSCSITLVNTSKNLIVYEYMITKSASQAQHALRTVCINTQLTGLLKHTFYKYFERVIHLSERGD